MNCRDIEQELSAYIDGEVTDAVRAEIEAHVATCPDCRKQLAELKKLAEGVAKIPKPQPEEQLLSAVRRKIAADNASNRKTWTDVLFRPAWLKVPIEALALIAILVTATILIRPANRSVDPLAMKQVKQTVRKGNEYAKVQAAETPVATAPVPANAPSRMAGSMDGAGLKSPPAELLQEQVAQANKLVMLTGGESIVVLNFDRPSELITVKSDDAGSVRDRAQVVASLLNGRVIATENAGDGLGNVYVVVPGARVQAFKSQFTAAQASSGLRRKQSPGLARGGPTSAGGVADKLEVPASMAFTAGSTDMVDRVYFRGKVTALVSGDASDLADETAGNSDSNVVLEIQVIPAKP